MYLKLALYDIRRSDIFLLHNEYYRASLQQRTQQVASHFSERLKVTSLVMPEAS